MEYERPEAAGAVFLSRLPISLNFAVSARIHGPLTRAELEAALAGLGRRHPLLAVRAAERADGTAYFTNEGVPPIPLRVIEGAADDDWVGEVERDIQRPSNYLTEPEMRCIWLRGSNFSDVVLICDHLLADGRAAVIALRDLLDLLAVPSRAVEPLMAPPVHELVPPDVVRQIKAAAAGQEAGGPESRTAAPPTDPGGPVCVRPFALTAQETSALIRRCREEGVTVQAALCAAFLTPFAERQPDQLVRRAEIPVDLRPRLVRPVGDAYASMVGLTIVDVDCTPGNLWGAARSAAAALADMRAADFFAVPPVTIPLTGKMPNPPWDIHYDLSISNLGRIDIPADYGNLRLESIYGPVFPATGPDHVILGVSTFAGRMRCTYSSRRPDAEALMTRGHELLGVMHGLGGSGAGAS
jgi:hypothetical protein